MTKYQLAKELSESASLPLSAAIKAVEGMVCILRDTLARGEDVTLRGLCTLAVVSRKERKAQNIHTGTTIIVPSRRTVKFKPGKELKKLLSR